MIETLTTAVIVLAVSLVGLVFMFGVLLSDHNRRINKIKKDTFSTEKAQRNNYSKLGILEERLEIANLEIDRNSVDHNIAKLAGRHENTIRGFDSE